MSVKEICPTTAQQWLSEGAILVDVREVNEVEELAYNVDSLTHIPLSVFEEKVNEIPKDKKVIMACRSGARSMRATGYLMNLGYTNVINLEGGIIKWVQKGFPTKGNTATYSSSSTCGPNSDCC